MPFKITFENSAGELDSRQAETAEGAKEAAVELLSAVEYLNHGDILRVVETD